MAGILDQQMNPDPADVPGADASGADDQPGVTEDPTDDQPDEMDDTGGADASSLTPQALEAEMHLPGPLKKQLDKIVLAGMKVMFDPKTHHLMLQELDKPGPIEQKLAQGIAGLVGVLFQQSQHSMPPQLLIPAGILLMAHAVQYLQKAGEPVTGQQFAAAMRSMIELILQQAKVDPAKLKGYITSGGKPAGNPAPTAAPQPPQGILAQAGAQPEPQGA